MPPLSRRSMLAGAATIGASSRVAPAVAQDQPLRIGLMLPFSGADAALGEAIGAGFDLYVREIGRMMGGRAVELTRLDDQSDPAKASANVNRLLGRERAEVMIGTVNAAVSLKLVQAAKAQAVPLIIPGAGNIAATRDQCGPSIFRSSFSNWQPAYGMGKALAGKGVKKAAWVSWSDTAGTETADGFRDGLRAGGAELIRVLAAPFPETNFQTILARLPGLGVEAVGAHFTGAGAIQFVKDYAAAGLREKLPLCGTGFLTENLLQAQGVAAEGLQTALHCADDMDNPKNTSFRIGYKELTRRDADIYAVQGYDAAQMLAVGLAAVKGDITAIDEFAAAIRGATIDSPRGAFTISASHNPIQTIWLREARSLKNRVIGVAALALEDPGTGCPMI